MRHLLTGLLIAVGMADVSAVSARQQAEKPVDENSARVTVAGCLRGRNLVTIVPEEVEPVQTRMAPGRVFRLSGPKALMNEVKKRDKTAVQVTGLVRKSALTEPQGTPIAGGRVRIGTAPMNQDPTRVDPRRDPLANVEVFDVESMRPIDATCPK
jgi:hypothetical protein